MKKLTTEDFIKKANLVHNNKYDYSLSEYNGSFSKVIIICKEHGSFLQVSNDHLKGAGCKKCNSNIISAKMTLTTDNFIEKASLVHNNKYDYSKTEYIKSSNKVCIICPIHGEFWQVAGNHLKGKDCYKCKPAKLYAALSKPISEFINKANCIHNNSYDYSKANYINNYTKINIICNNCNANFFQTPSSHLSGSGCPKCKISKGEDRIKRYLDINNIEYIPQKTFQNLFYKNNSYLLRFDFYLPKYNLCIEFQGEGHYRSVKFFGGEERFADQQNSDKLKKIYCKENNIFLLEIPYWKINYIDFILESTFKQYI